jgi:hypothetical protein
MTLRVDISVRESSAGRGREGAYVGDGAGHAVDDAGCDGSRARQG